MLLKEIVVDRRKLFLEQIESEVAVSTGLLFDRLQELSNNFKTSARYLEIDISESNNVLSSLYTDATKISSLTQTRAMIVHMINYLQQ